MLFQNIVVKKIELNNILRYQTLNSIAMSIIAFILCYILFNVGFIISAHDCGLAPILKYPTFDFANYNIDWTVDVVTYVYSSGLYMSLFVAILAFVLYLLLKKVNGLLHLFFIWIIFHSVNLVLVQLVEAPWSRYFLGGVLSWHFWSRFAHWVLAISGMFALITFGIFITILFLKTAYTSKLIKSFNQKIKYFYRIIGIPIIVTNVFVLLFNLPLKDLGMLMVLIPVGNVLMFLGGFLAIIMFQKIVLVRHEKIAIVTTNGFLFIFFCILLLRIILLKSFWF
ncbi:MAG: hypothetical protein A2X12_04300 [Bacteroidetes bacterium GWE2_29_8]|nr:MAG: hypothetical protein A2X12_04300 [Bacteroidetes bacterium GWE2_29_8]OFY16159.1 MAG: hypothetical protein A2X02_10140 [Bacteroidetes bacterium GWF2_29_10]